MSDTPDIAAIMNAEVEPVENVAEERELSPVEKEATEQGWRPKEEFDGDPDKWVSAHEFVRYGKLQKTMNKMKEDFDGRLREVNTYHEMQKAQAIADLKAQQKLAVRSGDEDTYDAIQKRIETFQDAPAVASKDPVVADWEARNPWIQNPKDPKTIEANAFYISAKENNPGISESDALAYVDERLRKLYPSSNPLRDTPTRTETGGQRATVNSGKRALEWGDLNADELKAWKSYGEAMFKDKKVFLKVAADARKK